ncbi:DNA-binding NarL/FixJ family response regulator [Microbacterium trichothecenolyticum]|uniref:LuxR C-terminal-related transcriptional regulator n=1 Tax=Microbacterium trichothecenolyticum TaxID=69370 RepID=UPI0028601D9B|nr:LuxR C-terminal-related transcriptional regulator [Microbacterium trichothecenolyticum]MDR7185725.1 DNA-binding NarL/FixJ family response regulator [Microbacterium trichothecenolyticum]
MNSSSDLDAGRAAVADRRWADAWELLAGVDARDGLGGSDLELLATAALLRGEAQASIDALSRAYAAHLSAGDTAGAARSAGWLALNLIEQGDFTNSVLWAARAMRIVNAMPEPGALAGFARMAPAVGQLGSGNNAEAVHAFEEVLAIADREADRELATFARLGLGKSLIESGAVSEGLGRLDQAMTSIAAGDVAPLPTGVIVCGAVSDAVLAFDLDRAAAWTGVLGRWCVEQPQLIAFSGQYRALEAGLLLVRGAWTEASTAVELALSRFRAGDYRAIWGAPYQHGELSRLRGAFHSAEESYRRAGESGWEPQPGLSLLHLALGRAGRAQDEIRRSAAGADPLTRRYLLPAVAEVEVAAGDHDAARRAVEELRDASTTSATPMLDATIAATDARVLLAEGRMTDALDAARKAVRGWDLVGAPYEVARSRVLAGRALRAIGEAEAAREEFDAARTVFLALGAEPAVAELAAVMGDRRAGALTTRELEVLRLVSTGLTNRGIGERLSLSEKTVARHLANIFGKLGITSRAAATAYAYENGLV